MLQGSGLIHPSMREVSPHFDQKIQPVRDLPSFFPRRRSGYSSWGGILAHNTLRPQVLTSCHPYLMFGLAPYGPRMTALAPDNVCFLGKKGKNKEQKGCAV